MPPMIVLVALNSGWIDSLYPMKDGVEIRGKALPADYGKNAPSKEDPVAISGCNNPSFDKQILRWNFQKKTKLFKNIHLDLYSQ